MNDKEIVTKYILPTLSKNISVNSDLLTNLRSTSTLLSTHQRQYRLLRLVGSTLSVTWVSSAALLFTSWVRQAGNPTIISVSIVGGLAGISSGLLSLYQMSQDYKLTNQIEKQIENCLTIYDNQNSKLKKEIEKIPGLFKNLEDFSYQYSHITFMISPLNLEASHKVELDFVPWLKKGEENEEFEIIGSEDVDQVDGQNGSDKEPRSKYMTLISGDHFLEEKLKRGSASLGQVVSGASIVPYALIRLMMRDYYDMVMSLTYEQLSTTENMLGWARRGCVIGFLATVYEVGLLEGDLKKIHPLAEVLDKFVGILEGNCRERTSLQCILKLWIKNQN